MSTPVNRRRYDSTGRRAQAQHNRAAILSAAGRGFLAHGYAATTMAVIAADAGVSVETIYKVFGNKPGVLKAVFDAAVGSDEQAIPAHDRDVLDNLWVELDPEKKLRLYGEVLGRSAARIQPVQRLARDAAASDP